MYMSKDIDLVKMLARRLVQNRINKSSLDWVGSEEAKKQVASDKLFPPAMVVVLIILILLNIPVGYFVSTWNMNSAFYAVPVLIIDVFIVPIFILALINRILILRKKRRENKI